MFEQTFKNIDDILHKDAGCSSELDYVEQTSWILFLKYLDDFEKDRKTSAELAGQTYTPIIGKVYCWNVCAAPQKDGKLDHHAALTGDDLKDFVDLKLFPYYKKFKISAESPETIEYKIGEIFNELKNKIQSGYNLREILNLVDELRFQSKTEKHEMSHLYEGKIQNMGNAGRNGGEYYTPRPLIKTIVKVVSPRIGQRIYDGAVGSAGFLCEAFEYLKNSKNLTTKDAETLQKKTFYGKEKKSLAYIIGTMNMILHGVEAPNIVHTNTLSENISDIQDKDRFDIVLANPPFGGKERSEVQQNFPIKTGETAFLFLQHFIKILKAGGSAGVVIKNTFLSNTDNASVSLRKLLLESCNLHTVLDLPGGTFTGAGVKTVVLFFEKGAPTEKVWYYQLNLDRNLGKTNPLNENDLAEFVELQKTKANSDNSWSANIKDVNTATWDLSVKNPNKKDDTVLREPKEILAEIAALDKEKRQDFEEDSGAGMKKGWEVIKLSEIGKIFNGNSINARVKNDKYTGINNGLSFIATKDVGFDSAIDYENGVRIPEEEIYKFKIAPPNTPLICAEGGSAGRKIGFTNQDVCFGNKLFAIVPFNNIESRYIYYFYFSSIFQQHFATAMAGLIGGVSMNKFRNIEIPIPPLSEQKRIVAILDETIVAIDKAKASAEKNLANAKELFESYLESIYSQNNPEWAIRKLKDVLLKQPRNGWSPPAANHSDYGTPVLTLSSVTGFIFRDDKIKFTSAKTDKNRHYWVENGDLLITRSNTPELVGHVAMAGNIEQPTIYPDLIMKMNCDDSKALTKFIYFQLRSKKLRRIITGRAQGANPTMKKIGKEAVQTLPVRIPSIQTQTDCVLQIESITEETNELENKYNLKVSLLEELKNSILKKAFEGEL